MCAPLAGRSRPHAGALCCDLSVPRDCFRQCDLWAYFQRDFEASRTGPEGPPALLCCTLPLHTERRYPLFYCTPPHPWMFHGHPTACIGGCIPRNRGFSAATPRRMRGRTHCAARNASTDTNAGEITAKLGQGDCQGSGADATTPPPMKRTAFPNEEPRLVGERGLEPPTPCTPCRCATGLRYAPIWHDSLLLG